MRRILFLTSLLAATAASHAGAAEITRVSPSTLLVTGELHTGDGAAFAKAWTPATTLVRVNLQGGNAPDGIQMARLIHEKKLDIEVDQLCASSCANYLFPAARHKVILPGAALALHGTMTLTAQSTDAELRSNMVNGGMPPAQADAMLPSFRAELQALAKSEAELAAALGVNPRFYDDFRIVAEKAEPIEQKFAAQKAVVLWWPSAQRLSQCYGIRDVEDRARPAELDTVGYAPKAHKPLLVLVGDQALPACGR